MNDWERYHAQQASYNLIAIVLRPKVFLFMIFLGFLLQLSIEHKDSSPSQHQKTVASPMPALKKNKVKSYFNCASVKSE